MKHADLAHGDAGFCRNVANDGFSIVPGILNAAECQQTATETAGPANSIWTKDLATRSRLFFQLGTHPEITRRIAMLIGEDVILWGVKIVRRRRGQIHPFHSDLETAGQPGKAVTVWIGLQNTSQQSSLKLLSRSHLFETTMQQENFEHGILPGGATDQMVLQWVRQRDTESVIVQPEVTDGDAIFFDGRLWHASNNTDPRGSRTALLLQYATPETLIRMPDLRHLDWPVRYRAEVRPSVLLIQGADRFGVNHAVPAPVSRNDNQSFVTSYVRQLTFPLDENTETGFQSYPIAKGATSCMDRYSNHVSVLSPSNSPHLPHKHRDEELLLMLDGEAELTMADREIPEKQVHHRISPGGIMYYRSGHSHTLRNTNTAPAIYMMFKWHGRTISRTENELTTELYNGQLPDLELESQARQSLKRALLFNGPTRFLKKLQCHRTIIAPGGGYAPHRDPYDVALIVLRGRIRVLDTEVRRFGVVFCAAGELHGMHNSGNESAEYLVLEFHGHHYQPRISERLEFAFDHLRKRARRAPGKIMRVSKQLLSRLRRPN